MSVHKFGIDITVGSNDAERLAFERDVTTMVNAGQITADERFFILNIPNVNYAAAYLKLTREKRERQKLQQDSIRFQQQSQAQAQSAQAIEASKLQAHEAMAMIDIEKEKQLSQMVRIPEMQAKYNAEYQIELLRSEAGYARTKIQSEGAASVESEKEDRKDERSKQEATQQGEIAYRKKQNMPPKDFTEEDIFTFEDIEQP
jgi:hypothetical protein